MKKTATEIYALLVCFVAMVCLSINTGLVIYDVISLVKPSLTISDYQYINHQNNDNYWQHQSGRSDTIHINDFTLRPKKNKEIIERPVENKLTQQRLNSYQSVIEAEKRNAIKDLIFELIIILVSSVLFFIHWRFVLNKK
ncbi:hypothetical protein SPBRAN_603 [uncultured Candidatus Thioglobus sp.]|nr:hypothetical protein SPBRAN_603 [uncultured Candidatus Thioglobus sp.]